MPQKKTHSLIEAIVSTVIGFVVALIINYSVMLLYGFELSLRQNFEMTFIFTIASVARGYFVRRLFNRFH